MEKIKNKKLIIAICTYLFTTIFFILVEKKFYFSDFCLDRSVMYFLAQIFIISNIIFDYKKIWSYIFKNRFIIGVLLFILMVMLGYSTSSIGQYDYSVQPNYTMQYNRPVWGRVRGIRSDEFLATTPALLSQEFVGKFTSYNDRIMGSNGSVLLFPRLTTRNISVLSNPSSLGFLLLNASHGYAFYSLLNYFVAFFGVFEMLLMLLKANEDKTENIFLNKKFLAFIGTLLLVFSPNILWWNCQSFIAYGSICILLIQKLLLTKKMKLKILYSLLLGIVGSIFVGLAYPAWQVPYGYMYLGLIIWIIIDNWKKIDKRNFCFLLISIVIIAGILSPAFVGSQTEIKLLNNTVYPGARVSYGGGDWQFLYLWFTSSIYGVFNPGNPCEFSQFLSFYPIPLIMAIIQIIKNIKNKKNDSLLNILVLMTILLSIWNYIPIGIFAKISLLYMSTTQRAQVVIGILSILTIIRMFDKYSVNKIEYKRLLFAIVISTFTILIAVYSSKLLLPGFLTELKTSLLTILFFCLLIILILNNKKLNIVFLSIVGIISLFCLATTMPIQKGLSVITDKPVAKEIRKINKEYDNPIWVSANTYIYLANYALANGSKIINSVNYYPNMDLWKKIDNEGKYEDVYNRYAHIVITIEDRSDTEFELISGDLFNIKTNINDVCKMNANFIISSEDNLDKFNNGVNQLEKTYGDDGTYIYKLLCN